MIDGPSAAITGLGGLSIARDGTGGLVYTKAVSGIPHVFVSALVGGQFQSPVEVDAGLAGASSQPVIAAGNGGVLLIGFINGGQLYVVDRASTTAPFGAPDALAAGASNPSLEMTNFGKGYLAFTVADGSGHDVRAAYYDNGAWSLEAARAQRHPRRRRRDRDGGAGRRRRRRRGGDRRLGRRRARLHAEGLGDRAERGRRAGRRPRRCRDAVRCRPARPAVAAGGDSSYADVAFQEIVSCGGVDQSRVLVNRLRGSEYDGVYSGRRALDARARTAPTTPTSR